MKVIPIYNEQNKDKFVDSSIVAPWEHKEEFDDYDTVTLSTSLLKPDQTVSLFRLAHVDDLVNNGIQDPCDVIHGKIDIVDYYIKLHGDVRKLDMHIQAPRGFTEAEADGAVHHQYIAQIFGVPVIFKTEINRYTSEFRTWLLDADKKPEGLEYLGCTFNAKRINPNRRLR